MHVIFSAYSLRILSVFFTYFPRILSLYSGGIVHEIAFQRPMKCSELDCPTCKGFKSYGICSHVLAINHILKQIDVGHQLKALHQKSRKGGNRKQTRAAMVLQEPLPLADTPSPALA